MTPQEELFQKLKNDDEILDVVSNDTTKISNYYPTKDMFDRDNIEDNFPRITFVLEDRRPVFYTDDQPVFDELQFTVDIWLPTTMLVKYTLNAIKLEIDRIMRDLGYYKVSESDQRPVYNIVSNLSIVYAKKFQSNL